METKMSTRVLMDSNGAAISPKVLSKDVVVKQGELSFKDASVLFYKQISLKGKTIIFDGDSITEENFRSARPWHKYLMDWYGFNDINVGVSGTGLVKPSGNKVGAIARLPNYTTDCDAYVFMGNMNDGTSSGGISAIGTKGSTDTSTLYGALKVFFDALLEKYPLKPLLMISSSPRSQVGMLGKCYGSDAWFAEWVEVWREMCTDYGIAFLDLYSEIGGLRPWNDENNLEFFSPDGVGSSSYSADGIHPNSKGHLIMARYVSSFIVDNIY